MFVTLVMCLYAGLIIPSFVHILKHIRGYNSQTKKESFAFFAINAMYLFVITYGSIAVGVNAGTVKHDYSKETIVELLKENYSQPHIDLAEKYNDVESKKYIGNNLWCRFYLLDEEYDYIDIESYSPTNTNW